MAYPLLFQPLAIGPGEMRNRIIFGSHATNLARRNLLTEQHGDYYAARAMGGAGMIVLEEHIVHPSDMPSENALSGYLPGTPQALAPVIKRIHAGGALALVQLNHNGQQSISDHHQRELWAPSPVPNVATREVPKEMEQGDIQAVIAGFAQVAQLAIQGGSDGVELQIADTSLLRQFLSPLTNQRNDGYGGPLEHRLRFVQETLESVDAVLGKNHILGVRFCADELAPWAGLTPEQSIEIVRLLAATGRIDYITVTMGSIFSTHMFPFHASMHTSPAYSVSLAAAIKEAVALPVFAAGRIMNADHAEQILIAKQADGVEMIRALIADPQLPRLSQRGQESRVRPCIACNQGCQVRTVMNVAIACNVNPDVMEPLASASDADDEGSAMSLASPVVLARRGEALWVVGGGPAGLEAARTAALRGKHVVLYEREQVLGGAVALAARGPGRGELSLIIEYLQAEIERLGVEIHTSTEVTAEMVQRQGPRTVIVATGARSGTGLLPIAGAELSHVVDVRRVLRGELIEGERVVVVDESDSHGVLSAVEILAAAGKKVEVVGEYWYVGSDLTATHDIVPWLQRVLARDVTLTTHTKVLRIEPGQVIVSDNFAEGERALTADVVVLGTYEQPDQQLYKALKGIVPRLWRVGDCVAPRRIQQAILEGRQIAQRV